MQIEFINNSKYKSRIIVNRILDTYAKRISQNVWHGNITQQGLDIIQQVLRKNATKQTCVLCYKSNKLLWMVGNRKLNPCMFEEQIVPTIDTFEYFDICKNILTIVSALHDIGKKNDGFQYKLKHHLKVDTVRHEFISCKIVECIYDIYQDDWLQVLINGQIEQDKVNDWMAKTDKYHIAYSNMPIFCQSICYFILTHHKLPYNDNIEWENTNFSNITDMLNKCSCRCGYLNKQGDINQYYHFTYDINLSDKLRELLSHIHINIPRWEEAVNTVSIFHNLSYIIRANLLLGDYGYSSICLRTSNNNNCWANTNSDNSYNQTVDEHLFGVTVKSVAIYQQNNYILQHLQTVKNNKLNHKNNIVAFQWQDKICNKIKSVSADNKAFFICNMASTGAGKTKANVKIMNAINKNMRFSVALGLRTLVKQTADNYVEDYIGFSHQDVGMNVGNDSFIHLQKKENETSSEELIDTLNGYEEEYNMDFDFSNLKSIIYDDKTLSFLCKPILVTTIDYLMRTTQCIRGKKYILPFLRVQSSDVIIDEIDDFSLMDIQAILQLIYVVGMSGKNLLISSATMPTDLAYACQNAFAEGLKAYNQTHSVSKMLEMAICDEFSATVFSHDYMTHHINFVNNRIKKLIKKVKHHGRIFDIHPNMIAEDITKEMEFLHNNNYEIDNVSGKKVSFGCIRIAHVDDCVWLAKQLTQLSNNNLSIGVLCYHSRFPLILRVDREKYLSNIFNRKNPNKIFQDTYIRKYIDNTHTDNIVFVLLTTAIEEVGKDHDFDWTIMELSSIHSLCQMKGRVKRHRDNYNDNINVSIMNYPIDMFRKTQRKYYVFPGVESNAQIQMNTHDATQVLQDIDINNITEQYCIKKPSKIIYTQSNDGIYCFNSMYMAEQFGYAQLYYDISRYMQEYIYLTAYPQIKNEFRKRSILTEDVYVKCDNNKYTLRQWNTLINQDIDYIQQMTIDTNFDKTHIWYQKSLSELMIEYPNQFDKYCTVSLLVRTKQKTLYYNDNFGFFCKLT